MDLKKTIAIRRYFTNRKLKLGEIKCSWWKRNDHGMPTLVVAARIHCSIFAYDSCMFLICDEMKTILTKYFEEPHLSIAWSTDCWISGVSEDEPPGNHSEIIIPL